MSENKRYFWLKLMNTFFRDKRIKALRKLPRGDSIVLVYQHMYLESLETNRKLQFEHYEETFEEEIASSIEEDIEIVKLALEALKEKRLIEVNEEEESITLLSTPTMTVGQETASTIRSREYRERQKMLQCNKNATNMKQDETLTKQTCNTYIESELDLDSDLDSESDPDLNSNLDLDLDTNLNLESMIKRLLEDDVISQSELDSAPYIQLFESLCPPLTFGYIYKHVKNVLFNIKLYKGKTPMEKYNLFEKIIKIRMEGLNEK